MTGSDSADNSKLKLVCVFASAIEGLDPRDSDG